MNGEDDVVERPRESGVMAEDSHLADLLDDLDDNVFNINKWEFYCPRKGGYIGYEELMKNINSKIISRPYIEAMREGFRHMPRRFKELRDQLFGIMKIFTLKMDEKGNIIEELNLRLDRFEDENRRQKQEIQELRKKAKYVETQKENIELRAKAEQMETLIKDSGFKEFAEAMKNKKGAKEEPEKKPEPEKGAPPKREF